MKIVEYILDKLSRIIQPLIERCVERIANREIEETIKLIEESDGEDQKQFEARQGKLQKYLDARKIKGLSDDIQKMYQWKIQHQKTKEDKLKYQKPIQRREPGTELSDMPTVK